MIKIEDVEIMGIRKAIKGMRNAMNSWDKSDSYFCNNYTDGLCSDTSCKFNCNGKCARLKMCASAFLIGDIDIVLASRLAKAGSSDRKFLRMIHVQADVTAPLYWWKQADQYRIGVTTNSTSTMHKIHAKRFEREDFSIEHLSNFKEEHWLVQMDNVIACLNVAREKFIETKDKMYWWQMIQLLPSSFNQLRTIDLNYETLFLIYHQRKNHKLDEWKEFCKWIETLPYMREFLGLDLE